MSPRELAELKKLSDNIATELVFAEAGKDLGLLPINSLLCQIEEALALQTPIPGVVAGVRVARGWIDRCLDGSGTFCATDIKNLGAWTAWMQEAIRCGEAQTDPPAIPTSWGESGTAPDSSAASIAVAPSLVVSTKSNDEGFTLNLESDADLLREFVNESLEHLQNIEQGALTLEDNPMDADTLNSIFRAFHTFKGGSGFLNLSVVETLAHELESLLDLARRQKLTLTSDVINVILAGGDTLKRFTTEISAQLSGSERAPIVIPTAHLLARIRAVRSGDTAPPHAVASTTAAASDSGPTVRRPGPAGAVKVDTSKLDGLIDLVGEMVVAQSLVVQNPDVTGLRNEKLTRDLARLARISKDLQRTAMALRMVPIHATFQKMARLVRDLSTKLGKEVELVTEGDETELDRTLVEEISDPLVHMIRNSVDHGIESPEARTAKGKLSKGTVRLRAFHRGGNIVIEIADDGGGLNRDRILAKAIEQGLAKKDESLAESQIFNFILAPGFSTAEKVTDVSGRGVGMDVVRRNIEKLRGKIEIRSSAGRGSTFSIYLPLTLAIIDGLLVAVGQHRYILPTLSVCESFRPTPDTITHVQGRGEVVTVRGRLQPLLRLYEHLGVEPTSTDPTRSVVVVLESGASTRCVMVDQLLGKQEIVIKSLGEVFRRNRSLAGAAILGDGGIGIILDAQALVHLEGPGLQEAA